MRERKKTLNLECELTDAERLIYSKKLAGALTDKSRSEDRLKSFQTQMKAEIAGYEANINMLSDKINTGHEFRDVECAVEWLWEKGEKHFIRIDTGEVAKVHVISEGEQQEELNLRQEKANAEEPEESEPQEVEPQEEDELPAGYETIDSELPEPQPKEK